MPTQLLKGTEFLVSDGPADTVFTPEDFTDEQKQLADTIEQFVANEVSPNVGRMENHDLSLVVRLLKKCGELGLFLIDAPEEYGGLDLSKATGMLAAEKISLYAGFYVSYMAHAGIGTLPLVYYGSEEQKKRYMRKIITGEWLAAYCLTEPNSGSDALGARSTAVLSPDGGHYVLNGTKQFITNGGFADLFTVFAKIDGKQFTAFLVERTYEGLSAGVEEKKMGIRGSSTTQVILEDVKVPVGNVLGAVGKGHKIAFNVLNDGRFKLGAAVTGAAKHAFVEAVKYANQRMQFGVPIGTFGAVREKIADMAAGIFASESLVYRLAGRIDDTLAAIPKGVPGYYEARQRGIEEYSAECAIAKVFCSEMLSRVVDETVQIHGGYGFLQEYPAERFYRDERVNRIFEGTNEINRILIAKTLLKRAATGKLPMEAEARRAREAILGPLPGDSGVSSPFSAEKALLKNLKHVFAATAWATASRFGERVKDEQEILGAVADIAITIFALESVVLRAEKIRGTVPPSVENALASAVKVFAFHAGEASAVAARRAVLYGGEDDVDTKFLDGIQRFSRYDAPGLLSAKRNLADAALSGEKYPFGR